MGKSSREGKAPIEMLSVLAEMIVNSLTIVAHTTSMARLISQQDPGATIVKLVVVSRRSFKASYGGVAYLTAFDSVGGRKNYAI